MSKRSRDSIEFIDGPYDGHVEPITTAPDELPERIICCVSENEFRSFQGQCRINDCEITSFAIYVRQPRNDRSVFLFTNAVAPEKVVGNNIRSK